MLDKNDILTKNIKEILDSCPGNDNLTTAINIMNHIRGYKDKYFRISDQET